jgi:hypothetical protein
VAQDAFYAGTPQLDLEAWIKACNGERPHQGACCFGKMPVQTILDVQAPAKERPLEAPRAARTACVHRTARSRLTKPVRLSPDT